MRRIILLLSVLALHSACEQTIDFDIPNPGDRLTVELRLEADTVAKAFISHSTYVLSNKDPQALNNAQAVLIDGQGQRDSLRYTGQNGDGVYLGQRRLRTGENYRVEISHPDYPSVSGRDFIPPVPALLQTSVDTARKEIVISWQDPAGAENYYQVSYFSVDVTGFANGPLWLSTFDPHAEFFDYAVDPFDQDDGRKRGTVLYLRDANFDGQRKELRVNYESDFWSPRNTRYFELEFASLSRSYYLFDRSKAFNNNSIGLFSFEEPVPLYNNIDEGYGAIAGRSRVRVELRP